MRDISHKTSTLRTAVASATLRALPSTLAALREGRLPKGDPLPVAKVAAIQAAKETSRLIPYCHPVRIDWVGVEFIVGDETIETRVTVKAIDKTGVEMEALAAAATAALNLYDNLKPLDDDTMEILSVKLLEKRGGKSDWREKPARFPRAAVVVISDSVAAGTKQDAAGRGIAERLKTEGLDVAAYEVIPDEPAQIAALLIRLADEEKMELVMTTGGTGLSKRDRTPEAMAQVIDRDAPGIAEAARQYGQSRTPWAMLSRGRAGLRGETLIINLPGSKRGAAETLDALFPAVLHALKISKITGGGHVA